MSNPEAIATGIVALLAYGPVSIELSNPEVSGDNTERDVTPYVYVVHQGRTWRQPIRRGFNRPQATLDEIAGALGAALERVLHSSGSATANALGGTDEP